MLKPHPNFRDGSQISKQPTLEGQDADNLTCAYVRLYTRVCSIVLINPQRALREEPVHGVSRRSSGSYNTTGIFQRCARRQLHRLGDEVLPPPPKHTFDCVYVFVLPYGHVYLQGTSPTYLPSEIGVC